MSGWTDGVMLVARTRYCQQLVANEDGGIILVFIEGILAPVAQMALHYLAADVM
jgi:hypothetical protein